MSMDRCQVCDAIVDTDYFPEGYYWINDDTGKEGTLDCYICPDCQDRRPDIVEAHKERGFV